MLAQSPSCDHGYERLKTRRTSVFRSNNALCNTDNNPIRLLPVHRVVKPEPRSHSALVRRRRVVVVVVVRMRSGEDGEVARRVAKHAQVAVGGMGNEGDSCGGVVLRVLCRDGVV
jgi:hypothetical protein